MATTNHLVEHKVQVLAMNTNNMDDLKEDLELAPTMEAHEFVDEYQ